MAAGAFALPGAGLIGACSPEPGQEATVAGRFTDASDLDNGTLIEGDICIVGAGAAGISMALDWIGSGYKVVLLEAGGFTYDPVSQEQYRGEIVGEPYFPLQAARLRQFGGTTGHWAGFCAPFDPIDFEDRDWVADSTWPIGLDELHPYYERAHVPLELGPYEYGADFWEARTPNYQRLPLGDGFWPKMWQFSPPVRFATAHREAILAADNIDLYTHATVCEIVTNGNVSAVESLTVRTLGRQEHKVKAKHYVLACGAIQNARLLLASNRQAPQGVGNDNDLVGRFFMEHIEVPGANIELSAPNALNMYASMPRISGAETLARAEIALTGDLQRRHRILNGTASLSRGQWGGEIKSTFQTFTPELMERVRKLEEAGQPSRGAPPAPVARRQFRLMTRQEQAPNPDSRVTLSAEPDQLGVPRVKLDWQLTELDQRSIRRFYELLASEFERTGLGSVSLADWLVDGDDKDWPTFLSGGWHHMGTTKMHDDPRHGVVDAHCRVHGLENLHIAGSGCFSTAGAPNPTLTLAALTLRLSDRIKSLVA